MVMMFVCCIYWRVRLGLLLVIGVYNKDYLQILKCVSFWLHSFCW